MPKGKDLRSFKPRRDRVDLKKKAEELGANEEQLDRAMKMSEQIHKYEGKSEQELMDEVLRVTKEQKQKGELDGAKLNSFKNNIWPMLNEEQRKKLVSILGKIEKQ